MGCAREHLPQNPTRTYGLGLGSRSPDGHTLRVAAMIKPCGYGMRSGICLKTLQGHIWFDYVHCLQPRWSDLSQWWQTNQPSLWNLQDGKLHRTRGHTGPVWSVAQPQWSSPSQWLVAVTIKPSGCGMSETAPAESPLQGHTSLVSSVQFSPVDVSLPSGTSPILVSGVRMKLLSCGILQQ